MNFRRGFVQSGSLRVHYRTAGHGPPVVMLHPSPLSSQAVLPVATAIARERQVFALDTPGYGLSEPLPARPASLDPYLPVIDGVLDALGIARCCLYGAATGAQLALEYASRYPRRVSLLVMDAAGHIEPEDCDRLVQGYFPDVAPRADGAHLATLWGLVRDLGVFFPWNDPRPAARIEKDLPPATFMQAMLLDYLRAGTRYDWAYRPAFHNERARACPPLHRPRSADSLARKHRAVDHRCPHQGGPAGLVQGAAPRSDAGRARSRHRAGDRRSPCGSRRDATGPRPRTRGGVHQRPAAGWHRAAPCQDLHHGQRPATRGAAPCRRIGSPDGALPGAAGRQTARHRTRPAGHGDNDAIDLPYADWIDLLHQAVCGLGLEQADLLGDGLGAHLAGQIAREPAATLPAGRTRFTSPAAQPGPGVACPHAVAGRVPSLQRLVPAA